MDAEPAYEARTLVTVVVFETEDVWELRVVADDVDPWTCEGLLREAWLRQKERNEALRAGVDPDEDEE